MKNSKKKEISLSNSMRETWKKCDNEKWEVQENHYKDSVIFHIGRGLCYINYLHGHRMTYYSKPKYRSLYDLIKGRTLKNHIKDDIKRYRAYWQKQADKHQEEDDWKVKYNKEHKVFPYDKD